MKIKRVMSYLLDMFIVSIISSLIFMLPIFKTDLNNYNHLYDDYMKEILGSGSADVNQDVLTSIQYDIAKTSSTLTIIRIGVIFVYFGIVAFLLKGRTLGKKVFGLQIVPDKGNSLNPGRFILRQVLVTGILFETVSLVLLLTCSKSVWATASVYVSYASTFVYFLLIGFVIFRDDERGLHDIICGTKVVSTKGK